MDEDMNRNGFYRSQALIDLLNQYPSNANLGEDYQGVEVLRRAKSSDMHG